MTTTRLVLLSLLGLTLLVGPAAAAPGVTESPVTGISGHQLTLHVRTHGRNASQIKTIGPLTLDSQHTTNGELTITITPASTATKRQASLRIHWASGGTQTIQVHVYPAPGSGGASIAGAAKQQAKKYRRLKQTWVQQKIVKKPTNKGVQVDYAQFDPTRGPINPKTGLPQGKWVNVPYNVNQSHAEWLYSTLQGGLNYQDRQAGLARKHLRQTRGFYQGLEAATILLALLIAVIYWRYRRILARAHNHRGYYDRGSLPLRERLALRMERDGQ